MSRDRTRSTHPAFDTRRLVEKGDYRELAARVRSGEPDAQWHAIDGLGQLGNAAGVPLLISVMGSHPVAAVRYHAAVALGNLQHPDATDALLGSLAESDDKKERIWIAEALGRSGDVRAVPALASMLESESYGPRLYAVRALGLIQAPAATSALVAALNDRHLLVRRAAEDELTTRSTIELVALQAAATSGPRRARRRANRILRRRERRRHVDSRES